MKSVLSALVAVSVCVISQAALGDGEQVPIAAALKVTVDHPIVTPEGSVTVTLTNASPDRWFLSGGCLFAQVKAGSCDGEIVRSDICTAILQLIEPGASISKTWDLMDDAGNPVPLGEYHMPIHVQTYEGRSAELCARAKIVLTSGGGVSEAPGDSCGIDFYGVVGHGSAFVGPELWANGAPSIGNAAFGLHIQGGLGAAPAVLLIGAKPAQLRSSIGVLAIDPAAPYVALPILLRGEPNLPGAGVLDLKAPIPSDVMLAGVSMYLQVVVKDAHASGGYAHSGGLSITICD